MTKEAQLQAWRAMLVAVGSVRDVLEREVERKGGLQLTWYEVLVTLTNAPDQRLRMQDLARETFLSKSGLSQAISHMEAAGLVRRESCASDRRGTFARLTAEGEAAFKKVHAVHQAAIEDTFTRHLDSGEAEAIRAALAKIAKACPRPVEA